MKKNNTNIGWYVLATKEIMKDSHKVNKNIIK